MKNKKIHKIYKMLLKTYKPQGWWPLSGIDKPLNNNDKDYPNYIKLSQNGTKEDFMTNWPRHHGLSPSNGNQRFEIVMGAILTQNTAWSNVEKALYNLNKNKLNLISTIKDTKQQIIGQLIRPAGYYNQKSERLKIIADFLSDFSSIGQFFNNTLDILRPKLLNIKGIGPETADSILLYAGNKATFVIDAYTKRIFSRLGICNPNIDYHELQSVFLANLPNDTALFKEYHALLVEHAKQYCKTKPICKGCPISSFCNNVL